MRVLDLGCGTGHLTAQIAAAGADVLGLDAAPSMIERARALYPHLRFEVARAEDFTLDAPVDAVFSNAALHWMRPPEAVVARVARALVPGGRFVAEMGGQGNVATVIAALRQALAEEGVLPAAQPDPWYFPGIAEYATLLERVGFEPTLMHLFDRPTPLDDCPGGAADWVRLFGGAFLDAVPPERRDASAARVADLVRPALYREGHWIADYRRLRFVAVRR
jgi:trans-aconitate methyltransferase